MPRSMIVMCTLLVVFLVGAALKYAGQAIQRNDQRALAQYDKHQMELLSQNCGANGTLMQDPLGGEFSCVWTNPDGTSLIVPTPSYPFLETLALK